MTKYVTDTAAAKSVSAYIVLNKKGEHVATVRAHHSSGGTCTVNIHDDKAGFQFSKAGGYGYDKFAAAISGLTVDGHELCDHSTIKNQPKKPKGARLYPSDFKTPKGWTLANYTAVSRETGARYDRLTFIERATAELGEGATQEAIRERAFHLMSEWEASSDCERGYTSCYREPGLKYLTALGYRVIQAI